MPTQTPTPAPIVAHPRIPWLFSIAALWNISAASMAIALPDFHAQSFFGEGTKVDGLIAQLNTQAFWVCVLLFGLGYAIVARDPRKNHGLVFLATLGKTYVFVVWTMAWARDEATVLALGGAIGDLAFAGVFVWFLFRARSDQRRTERGQPERTFA